MAISFPINPVVGQSVYLSGTRYTFDGIAWTIATTNVLGTRRTIEYTATSGQTEFLTTYNLDNSEVFINGIKLESIEYSISYTSINGKITLLQAANEGDVVEIIAYGTYDILNEIYYKGDVEPVSSIEGSLWFNTNTNILNIYDGSSWNEYKVGNYRKTSIVAIEGQTIFNVTYDINYVDVYVNGIKLYITDYTANNGTTIELIPPLSDGDVVEILSFTNTGTIYAIATESTDGLMSSEDKIKIDSLDTKYDPIGEAVALSIALG